MRGCVGCFGAAVVLAILLGMCSGGSSGTSGANEENTDVWAYIMCQDFVEDRLKAPSTADFPTRPVSAVRVDGERWDVTSYVDAENAFGANIRTRFNCRIRYSGNKQWSLESLRTY